LTVIEIPQPEWIAWMPSPPLVPDDSPLDTAHLARMTLGERSLEREVLAMFAEQALTLSRRLAAQPPDSAMLAHTLKGSARAIGAFAVADAAEALEHALQEGCEIRPALARLDRRVSEARAVIETLLDKS
jgi:HPt (histidine-containing phosphotransfer) domain-containing protein